MNTKVARLDSRRDTEAIEWADELRETEVWFQSPRFQEITRLHTVYLKSVPARDDPTVKTDFSNNVQCLFITEKLDPNFVCQISPSWIPRRFHRRDAKTERPDS